jgi:hypothetical protein
MLGEDQDALGIADGLSDGSSDGLSAGVLETGVLDTGVLEIGVVVAAGVLHARTAPPRLAASVRASRIRLVIWETSMIGAGCLVRSLWGPVGPRLSTLRATGRRLGQRTAPGGCSHVAAARTSA